MGLVGQWDKILLTMWLIFKDVKISLTKGRARKAGLCRFICFLGKVGNLGNGGNYGKFEDIFM